MIYLFGKHTKKSIEDVFVSFETEANNSAENIQVLVDLVHHFRPEKIEADQVISIQPLLDFLNDNPAQKQAFSQFLKQVFSSKKFTHILTDSGIISDAHFLREVRQRTLSKFLPEQPETNTLQFLLNQVFYKANDIEWVSKIPVSEIYTFLDELVLDAIYEDHRPDAPLEEVLKAISLLIHRISGRALEQDVLKMIPDYQEIDSPFELFEQTLNEAKVILKERNTNHLMASDPLAIQLKSLLKSSKELIVFAFNNSSNFGISIRVNQNLLRIQQQLRRIESLLQVFILKSDEHKRKQAVFLGLKLIGYNCKRNNLRRLIKDSTQTIAYEITKHTAKTGEHYITHSKKEYRKMFLTAMGGGLIVGFLCVIKVVLGKVEVSDFGHAFLYSLNYVFGFILIYLLGFTLATKQPAMTAAAIVKSIEDGMESDSNTTENHRSFAVLFSHLFRSQFIAFVGNVLIAFPVALLLIWFFQGVIGLSIVDDHKSEVLLKDLSPIDSLAIFHASIAGIFLFLSGIISGSISNKLKYLNVFNRIKEHPVLKVTLGKEKTASFAAWFVEKWPGIASNFWFGVFMGSIFSVGVFFGLSLDIRHITFGAGNLAIAVFGQNFETTAYWLFMGVLGIGVIGFFNFIVSFALSLWLALRSRDIPLTEVKHLFASVWTYFKEKPRSFFIPTKNA